MQPTSNNTGLPSNLNAGVENLSGFSMDSVKVHYDSPQPAAVQPLSYTHEMDTQALGQEQCLPHEAWHIAQQLANNPGSSDLPAEGK